MNNYLQSIINKHKEFNTYLKEININEFKQFSREELTEFTKILPSLFSFRYLTAEINQIIENKKIQEYPELLGVHHYPEIKELDYISEEDKIKLDNFLVEWEFGSYLYEYTPKLTGLFKNWSNEIVNLNNILDFLKSKQILERYYKMYICCNYIIVDEDKINDYLRLFELYKKKDLSEEKLEEYDKLQIKVNYLYEYCPECDNEIKITEEMIMDTINKPSYLYKIIKERDKSYDKL